MDTKNTPTYLLPPQHHMRPIPPSLSRTSSTTSISSDDAAGTTPGSRRTRKRFTSVQLMMLEHLFHQNSHPTREEREALAREGGMETKSVTIWFQNKRQTERKVALHNATNHTNTRIPHPSSSPFTSAATSRSTGSSSSRPSLDRVASRSELRVPTPRTPSRRHNPTANLWDNMPSSPLAPPASPPPREYVEFGKIQHTRTLEWACAAARLADKDGVQSRDKRRVSSFGDETDDEIVEAITPPRRTGESDTRWTMEPGGRMTVLHKGVQDDDMMRAALALCGLGRR